MEFRGVRIVVVRIADKAKRQLFNYVCWKDFLERFQKE